MYLFFDTETNGLPKNYKGSPKDLENWPRVIQLAWATFDEAGNNTGKHAYLIQPEGWKIPKEEFWIKHGYSTEKSEAEGIPMIQVLVRFIGDINNCKVMIAHNIDFDHPIVCAEMIRRSLSVENKPAKFCTMKATTDYCQIPGPYGYKWPKLEELHGQLFGTGFDGAHDALNDVMATAKCFFELKGRDLIKLPI